jgi:hypothetical protein
MRSHFTIGAVACVVVLGLSSCTLDTGPAQMGGDHSETCFTLADDGQIVVGDFIRVPDGMSVTIRSVSLEGAQNIDVDGEWISRDLSDALGGAYYPPTNNKTWDAREPAEGATADAPHTNVLVLLRRTGSPAHADSIAVEYEAAGTRYRVHGTQEIDLQDDCEHFVP